MREKAIYVLGLLGTLLLIYNFHTIFMVLPDEAAQGAIGRLVFIHPPLGITAYVFYFVSLICSIAFLYTKNFTYDTVSVSCIELGTAYTVANLVTGSLWGHIIWGVWWAWDLRMTTQLMCFLLYLGYLLLRAAVSEPTQKATMSSVLAIFAFADIPVVFFAIRLKNVRTQHPAPVLETGGLAPGWGLPFLYSVIALILIGTALVLVRQRQEKMQREIDSIRRQLHAV